MFKITFNDVSFVTVLRLVHLQRHVRVIVFLVLLNRTKHKKIRYIEKTNYGNLTGRCRLLQKKKKKTNKKMGYSFRELYLSGRAPIIRWRADVAQSYYKENMKIYHLYDRKYLRKNFLIKRIAMPGTLILTCLAFGYWNMKGQGMLHVLQNPKEGIREYYNHTIGKNLETVWRDEKAKRQMESYRKALEKKEAKIMEQYKKYEEVES